MVPLRLIAGDFCGAAFGDDCSGDVSFDCATAEDGLWWRCDCDSMSPLFLAAVIDVVDDDADGRVALINVLR